MNRLITHVPVNSLRTSSLRRLGAQIGPNVWLFGSSEFLAPQHLAIEGNCHIGRYCQIDARGGISIGRNVVIASHCLLITADHDFQSPDFPGQLAPIVIKQRAWVASRAMLVRGVTVGEGAVVAAGAVVVSDVAPWTVVGGIPARKIGDRNPRQDYEIDVGPAFY